MANGSDSQPLSPTRKRVATIFRTIGWIGFWIQLVLAVVSGFVLLFAAASSRGSNPSTGAAASNSGTGFGLFFAVCGLLALFLSVYWAFRYTRLARQLQAPTSETRPKKSDLNQALRVGLLGNLVGMLLTLVGLEAIVGAILAKSLSLGQGAAIYSADPTRFVQSLDLFVIQANVNTTVAHFAGIVVSLWLLNSLNSLKRPSSQS